MGKIYNDDIIYMRTPPPLSAVWVWVLKGLTGGIATNYSTLHYFNIVETLLKGLKMGIKPTIPCLCSSQEFQCKEPK